MTCQPDPFEAIARSVFAGLLGLIDLGLSAKRPEWRSTVAEHLHAGVLRLTVAGGASDAGASLHVAIVETATGRELFSIDTPSAVLFGGLEPGQPLDS